MPHKPVSTNRQAFFAFIACAMLMILNGCATAANKTDLSTSPLLTGIKPEIEKIIEISKPNRTPGSAGDEAAFKYLKTQFDEIAAKSGGKVFVHEFYPDVDFAIKNYKNDFDTLIKGKFPPQSAEYKKWKSFTDGAVAFVSRFRKVPGRNLILEIPGKKLPDEVVYLGAHYDTITHDHATLQFTPDGVAPGADDNLSSVAALLAAARELSQRPHDLTIRFVLFDYEEVFFLGSYALAKDLSSMKLKWIHPAEKILGLFNLEMVGWSRSDISKNPVVKIYTRKPDQVGFDADSTLAKLWVHGAGVAKAQIKPVVLPNGFDRSDNWSFWKWSFPAICVSQDWEDDFDAQNYHTSHDVPENLNYPYIKEITLATIEAVETASRDPLRGMF